MLAKIVGFLLCCIPLAGLVLLAVFVRRLRDRRLAGHWQRVRDRHALLEGEAAIAVVEQVYQHARHGAKAVIRWHRTEYRQDTWFEGCHPPPGSAWLVRGSTGWGPHNQNPNTFYVYPRDVFDSAPAGAMAAARRERERAAKKARQAK